jgi:hypothetical protein
MDWSARGTRRNDEWPRADGESVIDYVTATGRFDLLKYQFNLAKSTLLRGLRVDVAGSNSLRPARR